jgi:hypothetical protein
LMRGRERDGEGDRERGRFGERDWVPTRGRARRESMAGGGLTIGFRGAGPVPRRAGGFGFRIRIRIRIRIRLRLRLRLRLRFALGLPLTFDIEMALVRQLFVIEPVSASARSLTPLRTVHG